MKYKGFNIYFFDQDKKFKYNFITCTINDLYFATRLYFLSWLKQLLRIIL